MAFSIRNNIPANYARQAMAGHTSKYRGTLARISSGLEVNKAKDSPSVLVLSEQLRYQRDGLKQATKNNETAISFVQTTEAAMEEVNKSLIALRQLAVHAANDAANDPYSLQADQQEVANYLASIDRVAENTSFASKKLLNGENGVTGVTYSLAGEDANLEFVEGSLFVDANQNPGYEVLVTKPATRASASTQPLEENVLATPTLLTVIDSKGRSVKYQTLPDQTPADLAEKINQALVDNSLEITASYDPQAKRLVFQSKNYGQGNSFQLSSSQEGWLAVRPTDLMSARDGEDVEGKLGGYEAKGKGQMLEGPLGTPVAGLVVRYKGGEPPEDNLAGFVKVAPQHLTFHLGANQGEKTEFSLLPSYTHQLARGIENKSGFKSLKEIDVRSFQGANDALKMIVQATEEIALRRARLGSLQKNDLEPNLDYTRYLNEEVVYSESNMRDSDIALRTTDLVKEKILIEGAGSALLHARTLPTLNVNLLAAS